MREIGNLSTFRKPADALLVLCGNHWSSPLSVTNLDVDREDEKYPFVIFTAMVEDEDGEKIDPPYGENFAAYLREHSLGEVLETPVRFNPNSGNKIKAWIWSINHANLRDWFTKEKKKYDDEKTH